MSNHHRSSAIDLHELDRMRPPQEARAIVLGQVRLLGTEAAPLGAASWRVLPNM